MNGASVPLPPRSGGEGLGVGGFVPSEQRSREKDKRVPCARALRRAMTDAEKKLWWHLRRRPIEGTHFRRQATIGPYFADFACHECRLVIEVHGGGPTEQDRIVSDEARTRLLASRGYRVLRFWNHEVLKETDAVMLAIYEALKDWVGENSPHP